MSETVSALMASWSYDSSKCNYAEVHDFIEFKSRHLFNSYHPTKQSSVPYMKRLFHWLCNMPNEEDQKRLLDLANEIYYFGPDEFVSLYITALNENIFSWYISRNNLDHYTHNITAELNSAIAKTWFCPLTDSMHIADFCHINHIAGNRYRSDWLTLTELGDSKKIESYILKRGYKYLVLMEDFIGSGNQIVGNDGLTNGIIDFVGSLSCNLDVLIVPLIICNTGANCIKKKIEKYKNIKFSPVIQIPHDMCFTQYSSDFKEVNNLLQSISTHYAVDPLKLLGYEHTGALLVMYTNCPDNSLTIIHSAPPGVDWKPLFPRSSRI